MAKTAFKPESAQDLNCISIMMSFLTYITAVFMNFKLLPITDRLCKFLQNGGMKLKKSSPLKLQSQSQPNFAEMILDEPLSKLRVHQLWTLYKMAAITKNRNFFKWPKLLKF